PPPYATLFPYTTLFRSLRRHLRRVRRIVDANHIPSHLPVRAAAIFVQIVVLKEKIRLVDRGIAIVNRIDVEEPGLTLLGVPDRGLNRDLVADLPPIAGRE